MQPTVSQPFDQATQQQPAVGQPLCPVCSGGLIELRGLVRCTRCHFSMCLGCEGGAAATFVGRTD